MFSQMFIIKNEPMYHYYIFFSFRNKLLIERIEISFFLTIGRTSSRIYCNTGLPWRDNSWLLEDGVQWKHTCYIDGNEAGWERKSMFYNNFVLYNKDL